jgi:hypothetical protein
LIPAKEEDKDADLFSKTYLNLMYFLQTSIVEGESELNGLTFTLDDFCFKPISGEGCIVESPMQYFKSN